MTTENAQEHITLSDLQNAMVEVFIYGDGKTEDQKRLRSFGQKFLEIIKGYKAVCLDSDMDVKVPVDSIYDNLEETTKAISNIIRHVLHGRYCAAYSSTVRSWNKFSAQADSSIYTYNLKPQTKMYRMRTEPEDKEAFSIGDMFHIPFNKRYLVGTARFSVAGFPSLYTNRSVYGCWVELKRPTKTAYCSRLEVVNTLPLLDLRFWRPNEINNEQQLKSYLKLLPLILASNIIVREHEEGKKVKFKVEYIVSQAISHSIVQTLRKTKKFFGVVYTSFLDFTEEPRFDYKDINVNFVIPTMRYGDNVCYCKDLCNDIRITPCVKCDFTEEHKTTELSQEGYEFTYFHEIERQLDALDLQQVDQKTLNNPKQK